MNHLASAIYALLALVPIVWFTATGTFPFKYPLVKVVVGLLISLAPPSWIWVETNQFERWVRLSPDTAWRASERAYFKLQSENTRAFWAGVIAVYAALLIKG